MARLLRKAANSNRGRQGPPRGGSRRGSPSHCGPFTRLSRIWCAAFASLLLDPLLPLVTAPRVPYQIGVAWGVALSVALLPCVNQARAQRVFSRLRSFGQRSMEQPSRVASMLLVAAVAAGLLPKLIIAAGFSSSVFLGALGIFVVAVAASFRKAVRERQRERIIISGTPWVQVEQWESQLVALNLAPILLARAISLCGALVLVPPGGELLRLPFLAASAAFLGILRPDKRLFVGHCRRCKRAVPIVLVSFGSCLRCDERLLASFIEAKSQRAAERGAGPHSDSAG